MGFQQILHGCGRWDLKWDTDSDRRPIVPASVRQQIVDGSTLLVFPGRVAASALTDSDRAAALVEGYITQRSTDGLAGWDGTWLLGKPNGDGPSKDGTSWPATGGVDWQIDECIDPWFPKNGITAGTLSTNEVYIAAEDGITGPAGIGTGATGTKAHYAVMREWLDMFALKCERADLVNNATVVVYSWRLNPGLTLDFDERDLMYRSGEVIFSPWQTEADNGSGVRNVPADIDATRSLDSIATTIDAFGGTDHDTNETFLWEETQTLGFNGPDNTALDIRHDVDAQAQRAAEEQLEQIALLAAARAVPRTTVRFDARHGNIHSILAPGDRVYVHKPGEVTDTANDVLHFGVEVHPMLMYVNQIRWDVTDNQSVIARTPAGDFVDLTQFVRFGNDSVAVSATDEWSPAFLRGTSLDAQLGRTPTVPSRLGLQPLARRLYSTSITTLSP